MPIGRYAICRALAVSLATGPRRLQDRAVSEVGDLRGVGHVVPDCGSKPRLDPNQDDQKTSLAKE